MNKTLSDNEQSQWIGVNEIGILSHLNSDTSGSPVGEGDRKNQQRIQAFNVDG